MERSDLEKEPSEDYATVWKLSMLHCYLVLEQRWLKMFMLLSLLLLLLLLSLLLLACNCAI